MHTLNKHALQFYNGNKPFQPTDLKIRIYFSGKLQGELGDFVYCLAPAGNSLKAQALLLFLFNVLFLFNTLILLIHLYFVNENIIFSYSNKKSPQDFTRKSHREI